MAHISAQCRTYIEHTEARRQRSYRNLGGIWTIGIGHTGPEVVDGLVWSDDQIDQAFETDIEKFETGVEKLITRPLTQGEFDALVDFAYNAGLGDKGLAGSTLLRAVNAQDTVQTIWELRRWVNVKGVEAPGLVDRRKADARMYLGGKP